MAGFEKRLMGKDGEWIRMGDLATSDGYWAYAVLAIENGRLVFGMGMPQVAEFYCRVDPATVDAQGRIISEANEAGRRRAQRWMDEQNRTNTEAWNGNGADDAR